MVSIAAGYLSKSEDIIYGQLIGGNIIDSEKPHRQAKEISKYILNAGFKNLKILNHKIEIFILAKKP